MTKFRKKPVIIDAVQWTGNNYSEISKLGETSAVCRHLSVLENRLMVDTMEGVMAASINDWIIRGVKGELYPCKPDIFEMTYERI